MLKNERISKIVVGIVVFTTVLSTGTIAFAQSNEIMNRKPIIERKADRDHKVLKNAITKEKRTEKFLEMVEKYTPQKLDQWKAIMEKRDEVRKNVIAKIKESDKLADAKAFAKDLRADVQSGEMTREEAKEVLVAKRNENKQVRREKFEKFKNENPEKVEIIKETKKDVVKTKIDLVKAVRNDDEAGIKENLNKLLEVAQSVDEKIDINLDAE